MRQKFRGRAPALPRNNFAFKTGLNQTEIVFAQFAFKWRSNLAVEPFHHGVPHHGTDERA